MSEPSRCPTCDSRDRHLVRVQARVMLADGVELIQGYYQLSQGSIICRDDWHRLEAVKHQTSLELPHPPS